MLHKLSSQVSGRDGLRTVPFPVPASREEAPASSLTFSFTSSAVAVLVVILLSACKPETTAPKKSEPPVPVKLVHPRTGDISRSVSLPATVVANQQAMLFAKVTGYLKKINVDKGDEVKEGDLLAEIEAPELIADLARAKAELDLNQVEYTRTTDAQKKAPDLVVAETVDVAKGKLEVARANLERAQTLLGFCRISAPFSGIITKRFADPGAFIPAASASSSPQTAALVSLVDLKTVRVQVPVPEPEVPFVVQGLMTSITLDPLPGKAFHGTLTRFAYALDDATRTMLAEIDLQNTNTVLRPGMFATVKMAVEKHTGALLLPVEAVSIEKSGMSVFTVADGKAMKVPVKTGFNDGTSIEILDGIKPDAAVVLIGKSVLNNGQAVSVQEMK